ncbi:MAG: hypothetical protein K2O18_10825 [Oscillospiraceae bacterium]|nr:hypothetical protein [Oscillospiraceae bacterium]
MKERVNHVLNYKKPAFWVIAASCAICIAAAVCFLTDPVEPSFDGAVPASIPQTDAAPLNTGLVHTGKDSSFYTSGALLYQHSAFSSYFTEGPAYAYEISENKLTVIDSAGNTFDYGLTGTASYTPEKFYALFDGIAEPGENDLLWHEELSGGRLLPPGTTAVIRNIYHSIGMTADGEISTENIWAVMQNSQTVQLWTGGVTGRLYALLPLQDSWMPGINLMQWTFDPSMSTLIPICFDLNGPVSLTVNSGSLYSALSLTAKEGTKMNIESGQTVYWQPSESTAPESGWVQLTYSFRTVDGLDCQDQLELRALMDYCGLYGTKTYGISNNWLGSASSAVHCSALRVDGETGGLVVYDYSGGFPYLTYDSPVYNFPRITGRNFPPDVKDVYPVQAYPVQTP